VVYGAIVAAALLALSLHNYRRYGFFGLTSLGNLQLFALVADAGALAMDSPRNAEYKRMIRPSYEHFLAKYPPAVNAESILSVGWPLYRDQPWDPAFPPPAEIIAESVGKDESKVSAILNELAFEGLLKYPGRYLRFALPSLTRYLTYFGGRSRILDNAFFATPKEAVAYMRANPALLPSFSRDYPNIIPSFVLYRRFAEKQLRQPLAQRTSLILTWLLWPFVFFELVRPRVLSKENRILVLIIYLIAFDQAVMGLVCVGTFRYILPMAGISYLCLPFGLAVLYLQLTRALGRAGK
jgi:hypothetical protein